MPKKEYTERELVDGCIRNDRVCQEFLYRKYFPKMIAFCMRYTSDREKALDILNQGFLRVFQKVDTFSHKGSFEGWIRKLVFHSISDHFRKEKRYAEMILFEERDTVDSSDALSKLYLDDLMTMVRSLPPATQKVFELYAIEGFTHVEIAEQIGISEGTSKWHLSEARKKLKRMLKLRQSNQHHAEG